MRVGHVGGEGWTSVGVRVEHLWDEGWTSGG